MALELQGFHFLADLVVREQAPLDGLVFAPVFCCCFCCQIFWREDKFFFFFFSNPLLLKKKAHLNAQYRHEFTHQLAI